MRNTTIIFILDKLIKEIIKKISLIRLEVKGPPKFITIKRNHIIVKLGLILVRPLFKIKLRE